jgi:hypothetical protein
MMVEVAVAPGVRMGNEAERRRLTSCGVPGAALRTAGLRIGEARRLAYDDASANASIRPSPMAARLMMLQIRSWLCVIGTSDADEKIEWAKRTDGAGGSVATKYHPCSLAPCARVSAPRRLSKQM